MHIAYLIPTLDRIGGAERQLLLLVNGISRRGWRVSVIVLSGIDQSPSKEIPEYINLKMQKGLADPRGWIRLCRWLHAEKPDILHAHLPHAALMARWSRLVAGIPALIDTIHSPAVGTLGQRLAYKLSSHLPSCVTAVSNASAESWLRAGLVNPAKLQVIPNGVDVDHWKANFTFREQRQIYSATQNEFLWLAVGRLDPVKDHATLLKAFARLPVNSQLMIAGAGPLSTQLEILSRNLNIQQRVRFLGFQNDVRLWMQRADGFVLSSRWEGLPVALLEAAACELPAVFTDTPGSRELALPAIGGRVPVGDHVALANAMTSLMALHQPERDNLGSRSRQSIGQKFSLNNVLDQNEALYRKALAGLL